MITAAAFVAVAAAGASARWWLSLALPRPLGTLLANVVGAFLLGLVAAWSPPALTVVGVGGLGAFTTFSTLADDVVASAEADPVGAVAYVVVTFVGGIGAAAAGLALA